MAARKGLLAILGPSDDAESDEGGEDMAKSAKRTAARQLLDAVEAGSEEGVVDAFEALYDHCASKVAEEEDELEDDAGVA